MANDKKESAIDPVNQDAESQGLVPQSLTNGEDFSVDYETVPGSESTIPENELPSIRTQDGSPLCQTFCPTVLVEFKNCKQKGITTCNTQSDSERISPISLLMYRDNIGNTKKTSIGGNLGNSKNRNPFEVMNSISALATKQIFYSESCAPFDQVMKAFNFNSQEMENFIVDLEKKYDKAKDEFKKTEANVISCKECLQLLEQINSRFQSKSNEKALQAAFSTENFGTFLYNVIFSQQIKNNLDCKGIRLDSHIDVNYYPRSWEPNATLDSVFEQARVQLLKKNPVVLSSICTAKKKDDGNCKTHCMVLTGEKKLRNKRTGKVTTVVKVHNSWGAEWQNQHNKGWVDVDLLKSLVRTNDDMKVENPYSDRKDAFRYTVSWFE